MAKRTAKSKAADDGSSQTFVVPGTTTPLRSLLRVGGPTHPNQTPPSSSRSRTSRSSTDGVSSSSVNGKPLTLVTIHLPSGERLDLTATEINVEISRDYVDATSWFHPYKTYIVGGRTFTIKGRL